MLLEYVPVFLLNLSLEIPVAVLVLRRTSDTWRSILACSAGNLLTHPTIHFLLPVILDPESRPLFTAVAEMFVLVTEVLLYLVIARPSPRVLALAAAAAANLLTFIVGVVFFG